MEQKYFQFELITTTEAKMLTVEWIEIESPTGSFFVGPGHSPLVSIIKNKSTLSYKLAEGGPIMLSVARGIFKVCKDKAIALLDQ